MFVNFLLKSYPIGQVGLPLFDNTSDTNPITNTVEFSRFVKSVGNSRYNKVQTALQIIFDTLSLTARR